MKESKTSTRAQSGKNACDPKTSKPASARGTASSRTSASSPRSTATGRASHNNNPQGHNQYTKK